MEGVEVSELLGRRRGRGGGRGHGGGHTKRRGREGTGGLLFAIQLTPEVPRALGKPGLSKAAIMSQASLKAAWHKGLSLAGWGPALKGEPSGNHRHHQPPPRLPRGQPRGPLGTPGMSRRGSGCPRPLPAIRRGG